MLRVRVLGELGLELDGTAIEPPASRRARSLLGLLAVDRRAHSRTQLAGRFWPDVLDESARTSLRSALSSLRRSLGPDADRYLIAGRDTVALAGDDLVMTDLAEFEMLLAEGRTDEALEMARGELLEGIDDDWAYERRDEHRDRLAEVLAGLASDAEESGDLSAAVALTRRQAALDPLAEDPQRELIRRLGAAGDRPAALTAYKRLQERLRTELGIAPSARTRELVESLRAGDAPEAAASAPPPAEPPTPPPAGPSLAPVAAASPSARPTGTVTLLFTDQVSSTETLQRLGDDAAEQLRRTHFGLLRDVAGAHGGQEVKNLGDGLMVAFASAVDAVAAAIGIQQAVHSHAARENDDSLGVRVGLNVGEPIVDEDDYFGTPVVVAKRLCDSADRGQILASDVVRTLVGTRGGFEFRPLGERPLKGIADPVPSCEVAWEPTTAQRIPLPPAVSSAATTAFVGRRDVSEGLGRHWVSAREGERRVVLLAGEPGIGKTRLAAEFAREAHEQGAAVLAGRCYEEALVPYQPFVEALRHYVDGCPPSELTVQLASNRRGLAALIPELDDGVQAHPPGAGDPDQERLHLFDSVASLLTQAALARPTIVLLDDLHWADEASLLLLRHVVRATESSQLMIVGTYRGTELDAGSDLARAIAEMRRARTVEEVELGGLEERHVAELIGAQSGAAVAGRFVRQVTERTDGNPFFIEELLRHVDDPADPELGELALPESVKDLLLRRLERLGDDCRRVLVTAAVAGREFELAVLERALDIPLEELVDLLEAAVEGQVVAEEPGVFGRYRFAHPLIRETIYGQLSATRRALVHRRLGEAIESLHPDLLEENASALARHFHAAGDAEKAYGYHGQAATAAEQVFAYDTAFEHMSGAIAAAELLGLRPEADQALRDLYRRRAWLRTFVTGDDGMADYAIALDAARAAGDRETEMHVLNGIGTVIHVRDSGDAIRHHEQSLAIAEELGDDGGQVSALNRLSLVHANQLDLAQALELGERALAIARAAGDERAAARALDSLKFVALQLGDADRLEELTTGLIQAQRSRQETWYLQWSLLESAFTPTARGQWDEATARLDEALSISRRIGDRLSGTLALQARCWLDCARGDYASGIEAGREAVRVARERRDTWLGWAAGTLALPFRDLRAWGQAREAVELGWEASERIQARAQVLSCLGDLAWIRWQDGDEDGAIEAARRWDETIGEIRLPPGHAYLYPRSTYSSRARVALAAGDVDRAEEVVDLALAPAERARLLDVVPELLCVLARCAEVRGDGDRAAELLRRGLETAGSDGLFAQRIELHTLLARTGPEAERAEHAGAARELIEAMAASAGDDALAGGFRQAALAELEGAGSRHSTS
jgi:class 3 adenylate cyclase/DNA-binding SARP family transcriptional activator/tetratricopeptide (TPR) repeat protein